ncbi:MAG: VOC family protein [Candidatus Rokubacteria bacterium]|nr:VOC family protein [Candidatus Rokubacteria bacterium]
MSTIRFDHVAIAVPRIADALPVLVGRFGGVPERGAPSRGFRWGAWTFAGGGRIELIEPMGADGFLHRFLAQRGPGVHHVTFKVSDLAEACDRARAQGYEIVGYDDSRPAWKEAFLHPKQALGIVVQFAQSSDIDGRRWRWEPPAGPPDPPPPATIVGVRLRARSPARAHAQWRSVLLGEEASESGGALVYRWPGSPMKITVEIDPTGAEGPLAIEVAGAGDAVREPALGVVFAPAV